MYLNNKVYDILRWIAQYLLPGAATLYFALSAVWGLPYTEQIVGSIVALNVFLGTLLGISTLKYNKAQRAEGYISETRMNEGYDDSPSPWSLRGKTYDILKWTTMILLPATGALYLALSQLWTLPYGLEIVGTVAAVTAFTGLLLGVSSKKYRNS